jgi:hypothetical protein
MKKSKFSGELMTYALRHADFGTAGADRRWSATRRSTSESGSSRIWARVSSGACGRSRTKTSG